VLDGWVRNRKKVVNAKLRTIARDLLFEKKEKMKTSFSNNK
jgi:hypothetical protein